jgi:Tol biopolymer transport system component
MVSVSDWDETTQQSTRALIIYDADGIEVDRIAFEGERYYASPRWSPVSNRIALHLWEDGRARYTVYDLSTAAFVGDAAPPPTSDRIGGKCGGGDMWRTSWSADGQHVLYSFTDGDTGANGVWAWDVASGEQRVILASYVSAPSSGPDGAVMFSAGAHIFVGTTAGGLPRILTDGSSPAWHFAR